MRAFALLLFVSLAASSGASCSDVALQSKYIVGVDTEDTLSSADPADRIIRMTNRTGHAFECAIPTTARETGEETNQEGVLQQHAKSFEQVLDALSARCFYRLEDWWTYELCYQKHVRQFHKEKDVLTNEFLLGTYEGNAADTDNLEAVSEGLGSQYVKQLYSNGDACDLTGSTRQTEVRYSCGEGGHELITSIKEPSTCHYVLTVSVPGLCQLPSFRQKAEAVAHITCRLAADLDPAGSSPQPSDQHQQDATKSNEAVTSTADLSSNDTASA